MSFTIDDIGKKEEKVLDRIYKEAIASTGTIPNVLKDLFDKITTENKIENEADPVGTNI